MTKFEMFSTIASLLSDNAEVVAFCEHEQELLTRKASRPSKPTKTQVENVGIKSAIVEMFERDKVALTPKEATEALNAILSTDYKVQKISALLTQLAKEGALVRVEEKRQSYYGLPVAE